MDDIVFLGVDPGKSGAIGWVYGPLGLEADTAPMPECNAELLDLLDPANVDGQIIACIEWIHPAIFQIGKASMSKLYGSYTRCKMALSAVGISFTEVKPRMWQQAIGIRRKKKESSNKWKKRLHVKAVELFPGGEIPLQSADALLIAEYCRRLHVGGS